MNTPFKPTIEEMRNVYKGILVRMLDGISDPIQRKATTNWMNKIITDNAQRHFTHNLIVMADNFGSRKVNGKWVVGSRII